MQRVEEEMRMQLHLEQPELRFGQLLFQLRRLQLLGAHPAIIGIQRATQEDGKVILEKAVEHDRGDSAAVVEEIPRRCLTRHRPDLYVHKSDEAVKNAAQQSIKNKVQRNQLETAVTDPPRAIHEAEDNRREKRPVQK